MKSESPGPAESRGPAELLGRDFRYTVFRAFLVVSAILGTVFGLVNLLNRRPVVNVVTGFAATLLCIGLYALSRDYKRYGVARLTMLAVFSIIWLPFGYLTSPGSASAMPYLAIMVAFILSVIARKPAEYAFPVLMILQMPLLFRTELLFPGHYPRYTDPTVHIDDLTVNFTIALAAIVTTVILMMREYDSVNRKLYDLSVKDDLTGLHNRRYLVNYLETEMNRSGRKGKGFALAFIDLDNFKRVNDSMGHLEGDRVLRSLADILKGSVRNYDIVSRFGGDEFVIVLPETNRAEAEGRMRDLDFRFKVFSEPYAHFGFAVSWGVAESGERTVAEMLAIADEMLYRKKKRIY